MEKKLKILQCLLKIYNSLQFKRHFSNYKEYYSIDNSTEIICSSTISLVTPEKRKYIIIGKENLLNIHCIFESKTGLIEIGNNVNIGDAKLICHENIKIDDNVLIAWGGTIYDHNSHSIYLDERINDSKRCYDDYKKTGSSLISKDWSTVKSAPIHIYNGAWIGFNSIILKGVTIGEGAVVAAGSVVTKDVAPYTVVGGNPARFIKECKHDKK